MYGWANTRELKQGASGPGVHDNVGGMFAFCTNLLCCMCGLRAPWIWEEQGRTEARSASNASFLHLLGHTPENMNGARNSIHEDLAHVFLSPLRWAGLLPGNACLHCQEWPHENMGIFPLITRVVMSLSYHLSMSILPDTASVERMIRIASAFIKHQCYSWNKMACLREDSFPTGSASSPVIISGRLCFTLFALTLTGRQRCGRVRQRHCPACPLKKHELVRQIAIRLTCVPLSVSLYRRRDWREVRQSRRAPSNPGGSDHLISLLCPSGHTLCHRIPMCGRRYTGSSSRGMSISPFMG